MEGRRDFIDQDDLASDDRPGQATFNERDRADIIRDKDETLDGAGHEAASGPASLDLENEPAEFVRGEIDVKTQMDRTVRIARAEARGHHELDDSPDFTPGGLEEVVEKTDQDLAERKGRKVH